VIPSLRPDSPEALDYASGVATYFRIPRRQVLMLQAQGVPVEELPVVCYVAAVARVRPSLVARLRLSGASWMSISRRFRLGPNVFYWAPAAAALEGPYVGIYGRFRGTPRREWPRLVFSDLDIINCVNLRFVAERWHRRPVEVMRGRAAGRPFGLLWRDYHEAWRGRRWRRG
jgi:hypothetical protein